MPLLVTEDERTLVTCINCLTKVWEFLKLIKRSIHFSTSLSVRSGIFCHFHSTIVHVL